MNELMKMGDYDGDLGLPHLLKALHLQNDTMETYKAEETDEAWLIYLNTPGFKKENLSVVLEEDGEVIKVTGKEGRFYNNLEYTLSVSDKPVSPETISSSLEDGILTLRMKKPEKVTVPVD